MMLRHEVIQTTHGEQALGEGIGSAHGLDRVGQAILLCLQRLSRLRGNLWGEVFQQPARAEIW